MGNTVYYFDISNKAYPEALDMFSQFFLTPLLNKTCVDKEIHAVDSEFSKNLNSDLRRNYEIMKILANQDSPFTQFGTGNLNTLQKPDIYDQLRKFYDENYR